MKILYILPGYGIAGGVITVFEHINRLNKLGHEVYVACLQKNSGLPLQNSYPLDIPPSLYDDIPKLARKVDIIVSTLYTTAFYVNDLDVTAKKVYFVQHRESLFSVPEGIVISNDHNHTDDEINNIKNKIVKENYNYIEKSYKLPFKYLCVSHWLKDFLKKEYNKDSEIIPNGINKDIFYPEPFYPRRTDKPIRVLIEASTNSIPWKGVEDALKSLENINNIEVWSISSDDINPNWKIDKHWKNPSQDEIRRIYSSCDILLKTSWYEGDGLPAKQAMTCGCAVITTDQFGSDDFIINGKNALLSEPRNIKDIRNKLLRLVNNQKIRNNLIKEGLKTSKSFDWDISIKNLEKIYEKWIQE